MRKENKICVIGVYFGNLPNYFNLWVKSAQYNPTIDFLIFTDQKLEKLPINIKSINMNLEIMKARASEVIGTEVSLSRPYKCCDYKPMYGLIFSDYLVGYDYWGHCDFDVIFGDIQYFFDIYDIYQYDRFLALGHLSFYRNTEEVNSRFRCNGGNVDYMTVVTSNGYYAFDEINGMTSVYLKNSFPFFKKNIFADIAATYDRYRIIDSYKFDSKVKN